MVFPKKNQQGEGADEGNAANARLMEKMKSRMGQAEPVDDDGDDGDDDDSGGGDEYVIGEEVDEDEPRQTRQERKRERGRIYQENEELKRRLSDYQADRERLAKLEGLAQSYQQQMQQQALLQQQMYQSQGPDPIQQELDSIYDEQNMLYESYAALQRSNGMTADKQREYQKRARQLEERKYSAMARRNQPQQPQQQGNGAAEAIHAILRGRYSDVYDDQRALAYANAEFHRRRALGEPDSMETAESAMEAAREAFGKAQTRRGTKSARPSEGTRRRFSGPPQNQSSGGGQPTRRSMRLDASQKRMAEAMYPDIDPAKAHQKWVNRVGKKLA